MPDRSLSLRDLAMIDAIASEGSISAAARLLHLSQPALSRRVVELEGRLGLALVVRGARGSAPTIAGARLLEAMTLVSDQLQQALRHARDAPVPDTGDVLIGLPTTNVLRLRLHAAILALAREDPATHILTSQIPFLRQQRAVVQGVLDVGFGIEPTAREARFTHGAVVWRASLDTVLVPAWHTLATRSTVGWHDLHGLRVGVPDEAFSPEFARRMRDALDEAGFVGTVEATSQDLALEALVVGRGERLAIVSGGSMPETPGVVALPLERALMVIETWIYWRVNAPRRVRSFVRRLGVVDPEAGGPAH